MGGPSGTRMFRDVEMNHPPAMMNQDHQDEQNPKCRGRDGEEIYRDQFCEMVVQKSPPGLGRGFRGLGISRETVRSEISIPNFSNSP